MHMQVVVQVVTSAFQQKALALQVETKSLEALVVVVPVETLTSIHLEQVDQVVYLDSIQADLPALV